MGDLYLSRSEAEALQAIDLEEIDRLIDQCRQDESSTALRMARIESCGEFVASKFRIFDAALMTQRVAKSPQNRANKAAESLSAGRDLSCAVHQMKRKHEEDERERELFFIDDNIMVPNRFSEDLSIYVSYMWRRSKEDEWTLGSITFVHRVPRAVDHLITNVKRKQSAAKQMLERQERLYSSWRYLRMLGLHSIREFFRGGGDPVEIPKTFEAVPDSPGGGLNNFSADFRPKKS